MKIKNISWRGHIGKSAEKKNEIVKKNWKKKSCGKVGWHISKFKNNYDALWLVISKWKNIKK